MNTTTAFIAIVGCPNVGKSSLLNQMLGQKIAIVSSKPQTTRTKIMGVLTRGACQLVFTDTPGYHRPKNKLGENMVRAVTDSIGGVDACLFVTEAEGELELTGGRGVDKVLICGGDNDTFAQAVTMLKPGGIIGSVNYLGSGEFVKIPRIEWGCGMSHKQIRCGLMPGGRLRSEKLAAMITAGRVDPSLMLTHRFHGFDHMEEALQLMKDKSADLIKPVVYME